MKPGIDADLFGDLASISIDRALYTDTAIFKATYWFTDRYYVYLASNDDGKIVVELRAKTPTSKDELGVACSEFCNSLVDYRVRESVLAETKTVREQLILKAFGEGLATDNDPVLGTKE